MYTINTAYQNHQERETGSIEVGKVADLVILERNLFDVPAHQVHMVRVMRTIVEGRTVFARGKESG
jgi:predicted amidohydrolase YtcJ